MQLATSIENPVLEGGSLLSHNSLKTSRQGIINFGRNLTILDGTCSRVLPYRTILSYDFELRDCVIDALSSVQLGGMFDAYTPGEIVDYIVGLFSYKKTNVTRLHSLLLKLVFGPEYTEVMKVLVETGLLTKVSKHCEGVVATGYRLNIDEKESIGVASNLPLARLFDKRIVLGNEKLQAAREALIGQYELWINDVTIDVTEEERAAYIKEKKEKKEKNKYSAKSQLKNIDDIINGNFKYKIDKFSKRIHTPFSKMPKRFRDRIKIDGEETCEVDIRASHAQFIFHLQHIFNPDAEFVKQIKYGNVYSYIAFKLNIDVKKAKSDFNATLNADFNDYQNWKIKNLFPQLFKQVDILKALYGHNHIARILQSKERIEVTNIAIELAALGIKHFTIHDSFLVKKSDAELVRQILIKYNLKSKAK